jgi:hypothetical protein
VKPESWIEEERAMLTPKAVIETTPIVVANLNRRRISS